MTHVPVPAGLATAVARAAESDRPNRKQRRLQKRHARKATRGGAKGSVQDARLQEAFRHHAAGRLAEAEPLYRNILADREDEILALSRLGALCAQTGRLDEAENLLKKALEVDPGHGASYMNLGFVYQSGGRIAEADAAFRAGIGHDPDDPDTQKNYGAWCQQQGRLDEAVAALRKGLAGAPHDPRRRNTLALALAGLGKLDEAAAEFERSLEQADDPETHANYGVLLAHMHRSREALHHLARGFERPRSSRDYQVLFSTVIQEASPERYMPELERAFLTCFAEEHTSWQVLSPAVGMHIWSKYMATARTESANQGQSTKVHLDGILADGLLLELLRKTVSINVGLEVLLVPLRRQLLARFADDPDGAVPVMGFMAAFAMQCHHNAYVFEASEPEAAAADRVVAGLAADIPALERPDPDFEARLALATMYRPIHDVPGFERLTALPAEAWSEPIRPLIELVLANPAEEQRLRESIEPFGTIDDAVSQAVRSQYEENPYPRWISQPRQVPVSFARHIGETLPWIDPPSWDENGLRCLVAGSGTGRHPINVAMRLDHAEVTTVDLSLASLAYAKRMALRYGVGNLTFRHGDLRQVGSLGREFRVIECCGVLHHLERPEEGLDALASVLAPDGYMRIALYSRTARRAINVSRERVKALGLSPDAASIRAYRKRLMTREEPGLEQFVALTDFFDLDSFRDLFFHVQEHQYDIPDLAALLARHDLEFLGFTKLKGPVYRAFSERFPQPGAQMDLANWAAFEADNPDTFLGMYDLWCRRRPQS